MSGILDVLESPMGKSIISGVAGQTNQPESKTQDVLMLAMPVLMQAMRRNAESPEGAESLLDAINNKHDGGILANLGSLFGGGVDASVMEDGNNILGHILGNKKSNVENALSKKTGMDAGSIAQILKIAAPILLGLVGNQAKEQHVDSKSGLEGMLGGLLKGNSPHSEQSFLESILDADGDGSIIDDVAGIILGGNKKKDGSGGLLGGIFNGK